MKMLQKTSLKRSALTWPYAAPKTLSPCSGKCPRSKLWKHAGLRTDSGFQASQPSNRIGVTSEWSGFQRRSVGSPQPSGAPPSSRDASARLPHNPTTPHHQAGDCPRPEQQQQQQQQQDPRRQPAEGRKPRQAAAPSRPPRAKSAAASSAPADNTQPSPPSTPPVADTSGAVLSAASAAAVLIPSVRAPGQPPSASGPSASAQSSAEGLAPEVLRRHRLSPEQHRQLGMYLDHLLEVNQSMNLTAVRDKGDAWERHVVDSLALLPVIDRHMRSVSGRAGAVSIETEEAADGHGQLRDTERDEERARSGEGADIRGGRGSGGAAGGVLRVVDVGTGAGLPGMVLAVARPEWKVTLLDSLRKRCDFLRDAAALAGLRNVEVVWCRAEEGGHRPELRQAYDLAVARAVAETRVLAELCLPFVRVGGMWVAAKGPDPEAEVAAAANAIRQLGGRQVVLERVESHSAEGQRTALVVAKVAPSLSKYPRAPGTPNRKPL